jgi:hypothetical protein
LLMSTPAMCVRLGARAIDRRTFVSMLASSMVSVRWVSRRRPVDEIVRRTAADVARDDVVVLLGRRAQATQLRRVMVALRADDYRVHYRGDATRHPNLPVDVALVVTAPGQEESRVDLWWGGLD